MLDVQKIIAASLEENAKDLLENPHAFPELAPAGLTETASAFIRLQTRLLENYHNALKAELAKQGILI